jgi:hypothetical protein
MDQTTEGTNRLWRGQYEVKKTKYVHALNGDYIFIERKAKTAGLMSGLYYIKVDFNEIGPNSKLTAFITRQSNEGLVPIIEFPESQEGPKLRLWDATGTALALAVSYVISPNNSTTKVVLKVLSVYSEWALCQEDELMSNPTVYHLEMIVPPCDISKVYVLYSTSDGLDGGRH